MNKKNHKGVDTNIYFQSKKNFFSKTQDLNSNPNSVTYLYAVLGKLWWLSQNQSCQRQNETNDNLYHISKEFLIFMKINSIGQTFNEHPLLYFEIKPS